MKEKIEDVIVVEGWHDAQRLKQFYDVQVIVTNGSAIDEKTLSLIKKVSQTKSVIVFTDPDYPGEKIRKTIMNEVSNVRHAFLEKEKATSYNKKKVGIEHASEKDLKEALANLISFNNEESSLTYETYLELGLVGSKAKRTYLANYLKIAYANAKTMYKRLNMMAIDDNQLKKIMEGFYE